MIFSYTDGENLDISNSKILFDLLGKLETRFQYENATSSVAVDDWRVSWHCSVPCMCVAEHQSSGEPMSAGSPITNLWVTARRATDEAHDARMNFRDNMQSYLQI